MSQPTAYLRDVDGTGSLHPCMEGDPGAIPVYASEEITALEEIADAAERCMKQEWGSHYPDGGRHDAACDLIDALRRRRELLSGNCDETDGHE